MCVTSLGLRRDILSLLSFLCLLTGHWGQSWSWGICVKDGRHEWLVEWTTHSPHIMGVSLHAKSFHSCLTLCDPVDCSPPGSSVHGDSPGKNTGVGCHALLQGIFPTQGSNPGLLHWREIPYHLSHKGRPSDFKYPHAQRVCADPLSL